MFKKLFFIVLLWSISALTLQAQDTLNVKQYSPRYLKKYGKACYKQFQYTEAAALYEQYLSFRPNKPVMAYELADCYRKLRNYKSAQDWYFKAYELSKKKNTEALYYFALMQKMNGDCENAKKNFLKFKKDAGDVAKLQDLKKELKNEIIGCDSVAKIVNTNTKIGVTHLDNSINKVHVEQAPIALDNNTLLFSSLRTEKRVFQYTNEDSVNTNVRKFYTAKKENGKWVYGGEYSEPFNENAKNTTNGAFSPDGKRFYFTKCEENYAGKMICSIYMSTQDKKKKWSDAVMLDENINMAGYTSTQPTVGKESQKGSEVVYFVSDRPDGRGGLDIYFFTYDFKKKKYSLPKNVGPKINTSKDDITPFYDNENHTLYFSSEGWPGIGGLDIFRARGESKKFTTPENVGAPINSSADDLYYSEGTSKEEGFFVSNRKGGNAIKGNATCCDDIYSFKRLEYVKITLVGDVFEEFSRQRATARNTKVKLYMFDPKEKEMVLVRDIDVDDNGKYKIEVEPGFDYKVIAEKSDFKNKEEMLFSTKGMTESQEIVKDLVVIGAPKNAFVLKNVYYELDKADLTPTSTIAIDTTLLVFLKKYPSAIVEISSHTDSIGSDAYNNGLSKRRANSVVEYLISKGIDEERLQAAGYGKTRPIAANTNLDGTDNPVGRAKNRRTEFRVVGDLNENETIRNVDEQQPIQKTTAPVVSPKKEAPQKGSPKKK